MNEQIIIEKSDLADLIKKIVKAAVKEGTEAALHAAQAEQLLDKMAAANFLGIKSYTTFRKMAETPGFPLSINGKFKRADLQSWLHQRGRS